ncbi:MAG: hypothetical protein RI953_2012, partial [Pseudomonadota bacterium]
DQAGSDLDLENLRRDKDFEARLSQLGISVQANVAKKQPTSLSNNIPQTRQTPLQRVRPGKAE